MPSYNNYPMYTASYSAYPANSYQQQYSQAQQAYMPQPMQSYQQPQSQSMGICWVDGEIGAKAQSLPAGWPANAPFPMWDTNDQIIYLKSTNQMGMPNPIQKLHYTIDDMPKPPMMQQSRAALPSGEQQTIMAQDMSEYATHDDLEKMKEELKATIMSSTNATATDSKGAKVNGKSSV